MCSHRERAAERLQEELGQGYAKKLPKIPPSNKLADVLSVCKKEKLIFTPLMSIHTNF